MAEEKKPVDGTADAGRQDGTPTDKKEKDIADILVETDAELQKVRTERDNYRQGLKKAKGKQSDEDLEAEEERIRAIAREEYLKTQEGELSRKKDELIKKLADENRELRDANRSKAGVSRAAAGGESGKDVTPPQNSPLSADLIAKLKNERGWTDDMIKDLEEKQRARQGKVG